MSEFDRACDWDLHAIVKAQISTTNCNNSSIFSMPISPYLNSSSYQTPFDQSNNYTTIFNELENLCQPFDYPIDSSPNIYANAATSLHSNPVTNLPNKKIRRKRRNATNSQPTTSRRRRNKHKIMRFVREPAGDHLFSDKWNWRKYGEKTIKGSLYRRSYYRCSNSGGCKARKQVEQSSNDPGIFLITYIDEHSHPCPTRRHSQSGHNIRRSNASTKVLSATKSMELPAAIAATSYSSIMPQKSDDNSTISVQVLGGDGINPMVNMDGEEFFTGLQLLEGMETNCSYYV